jgi:hypothetical protein
MGMEHPIFKRLSRFHRIADGTIITESRRKVKAVSLPNSFTDIIEGRNYKCPLMHFLFRLLSQSRDRSQAS